MVTQVTLPAFGTGASLGTTIALLHPELRKTQTGSVLLSAAHLDDIAGLVFAAIIPPLTFQGSDPGKRSKFGIPSLATSWRPSGHLAWAPLHSHSSSALFTNGPSPLRTQSVLSFSLLSVLSGFVAAIKYSGTSELFDSYLAGVLLTYVFSCPEHDHSRGYSPTKAFTMYLLPVLQTISSPVFFAFIGSALPARSLFQVGGSLRVVWRGILYALMILAKL